MSLPRPSSDGMQVGINLLTDDPRHPSGAHWFWTRVIPEMTARLREGEGLHLLVSDAARRSHGEYGAGASYLQCPWSNERPRLRTLSELSYVPWRLRRSRIDVFSTLLAPLRKPTPGLVAHFKTMHAYTDPHAVRPLVRWYRRAGYPRTARLADAVIINSESLRSDVERFVDIDPAKLRLIPEAVDHDVFFPGDPERARRALAERYGITSRFILFVASLWPYKNCDGLLRAFALARPELEGRQLVVVGFPRDADYTASLHRLADQLGIADQVVWVGGVPLADTTDFYRAADAFVYPSFTETFGLPILEAMATACPVVTSSRSAMPETAGGAAVLADPADPASLRDAILQACGSSADELRKKGLERASQFTWGRTAAATLEVYREVYARTKDQS